MDGEIIFNIDVMLAKRKMSVTELANKVGITLANISVLKNGKAKAEDFPLLFHIRELLVDNADVNIPWAKFETEYLR